MTDAENRARRQRRASSWLLPDRLAFYLQASIVVSFLAASSAPTPLYSVYQAEWGFSSITTTVVFGVYALAVLATLLTVGSLSDHVGRRPLLLSALALQAVAILMLTTAGGVPELLLARVIQGLSTGAAVGAVGAGMLDLNRARGTLANAITPMTGTATGALASGLLVQYLPQPTHLIYLILLGIVVLQGIGVILMRETSPAVTGALASLRPQLGVPAHARGPLLAAIPVLVAMWALVGLYGSVGPAVVRLVVGSNSLLLGGLALSALAASAGLSVLLVRNRPARALMSLGTVLLFIGVGVTLLAIEYGSASAFFAGSAVAGFGFGAGFQGAIHTIVPLAQPHERAGLLSTIYVVSYLSMGLPAVVGGFLVVDGGGLLPTAREYAGAVMVLAALALFGLVRSGGTRSDRSPSVGVAGSGITAETAQLESQPEPALR